MVSKYQLSVLLSEGKHEIKRQLYSRSFTFERISFFYLLALTLNVAHLHLQFAHNCTEHTH